jgi:hypothetical protein
VSDRYDFFCAESGFEAAEGTSGVLDSLHHAVEVLEVLPDKVSDAWVFGYVFLSAVQQEVSPCRTADRNIVDGRGLLFWGSQAVGYE